MDAHSRGRADDIDPADQWVLNPQTGNYELRLDHSTEQSAPPAQSTRPASRRAANTSRTAPPAASGGSRTAGVPGQRRRRAPGTPEGPGRGGATPPGAAGRRKRKPQKSRKKKALMWTSGVTAGLVVALAITGYAYYEHLNSNISTVDIAGAGSGGFKKDQAINILVIGTDKRTGDGNEGYGDKNSAGHADTTILFHVSKDRTNATAMSIPRDLMTDIPDCETRTADGTKVIPGEQNVRFNTSLGQAERDPGCTMRTVKEITGLTVDHFMMADFNAVKTLTTAIGGVEVCVNKDVDDKQSKLKLTKGKHVIQGENALAFVRTRHAFGNESDLDRIKTQQQFLSSMIRKMKSSETLTSPSKLLDLAEAATEALTVDTGIGSIKKLQDLGSELAKVNPKNITFTTLPVVDNPAETVKATVVVDEAKAQPLFSMMQNDVSLTEVKKKEKDAKDAQAALLKGARAEASEVRVDVYNGSGKTGAAQGTLVWLQNDAGVLKSSNKSNAPREIPKTTLEFAPNQADQARKLADLMGLPATALKQGTADAGETEPMKLTLGGDFKGAGVPITGPAKTPEGVQKVVADKQVCAE
ncbi:LytR family transcriptional regulator [Streptomyces sp. WAC05374]|uniref:LCP family glycopolymer transferase n=1 Tax=Streptomyces sp. WAC05374 TaxID=2487420 RepID=UPI000F896E13|nr:LCP family protein [Streptomyces sp. WAC05374]RST11154.1 LytR family transcriptional regulator [Streptomyces sp. WAC05374]TDF46939.1 LytR family transcriptional regulator [Streptomyces sp. WAC05374]TDF57195.1 LytR family transcriptional regulator [Streptomyces sp. WAC05374]TDF61298.1 LytR family transcriptional regulator [Streptomyces sp. WAC05374]